MHRLHSAAEWSVAASGLNSSTAPPHPSLDPAKIFATQVSNVWQFKYCLLRQVDRADPLDLIDLNFCAKGYLFPIVTMMSLLLLIISTYSGVRLQLSCPRSHTHRKTLFALLVAVGIIRGVYSMIATIYISHVTTVGSAIPTMEFLMNSLIPVNALSDLLTAAVDFLLTFFWLTVLGHKVLDHKYSRSAPIAAMVLFTIIGFVCFGVDFHRLNAEPRNPDIYSLTLGYIAVLLFSSAFLHFVTVVLLLMRLAAMDEQHTLSPKLRRHFIRVSIIGAVSTACWLFRGVVLIGRAAKVPAFVDGKMSFENPSFTAIYFCLFMNVPCCVVALSFLQLSLELFKRQSDNEVVIIGSGPRSRRYKPEDAVRSPLSPGSERSPFITRGGDANPPTVVRHSFTERRGVATRAIAVGGASTASDVDDVNINVSMPDSPGF